MSLSLSLCRTPLDINIIIESLQRFLGSKFLHKSVSCTVGLTEKPPPIAARIDPKRMDRMDRRTVSVVPLANVLPPKLRWSASKLPAPSSSAVTSPEPSSRAAIAGPTRVALASKMVKGSEDEPALSTKHPNTLVESHFHTPRMQLFARWGLEVEPRASAALHQVSTDLVWEMRESIVQL